MRTFDVYKTDSPEDGLEILERILQRLLDHPDCRYTFRDRATQDESDNWWARNIISRLKGDLRIP